MVCRVFSGDSHRFHDLGAAYNSYSLFSHFPACSFDWGDSGFAGSSNYGGELLYLSAPSCKHGLVLARGNFSTSHYASLSRAQIVFGGPATFGLEVSRAQFVYDPSQKDSLKAKRGSSYRLGALIERGCFNYRWPFNEYYLDANVEEENEAVDSTGPSDHTDGETGAKASTSSPAGRPAHLGTCQMFSFAKDGYFYQVLRVQEDSSFKTKPKVPDLSGPQQTEQKDTEQKQIVLTMGGPVWFHTFHAEDRLHDHLLNDRGQARPVHGSQGRVKTDDLEGATEANTDIVKDRSPVCASSPARDGDDAEYEMIKYWDCTRKIGLEAMVYKVSKAGRLKKLPLFVSNVEADSGPNSLQSDNKTRAYNAVVPFDDDDQIAGHRCQVFMAAIRLYEDHEQEEPTKWMPPPSSQDIYEFIGASPSSLKATGALWQTVSNKSLTGTSSGLNIDEASLIGRSLEKILQVDIAPVTFQDDVGTKHAGTKECEKGKPLPSSGGQHSDKERRPTGEVEPSAALVSNIYIRANVDLKSML